MPTISRRGFSLVDTLCALAVIGLVALAAALPAAHLLPRYALRQAAWDVQARLNTARFGAIFKGTPMKVTFSRSAWRTERYEAEDGAWVRDSGGFLEGVRIEANASPVFSPTGTVAPLATILVSNDHGAFRITLAITGRIKCVKIA